MNNIKIALAIVEDLRKIANNIEILVKLAGPSENKTDSESLKIEPITIEKVRLVLAEKSQSGKTSAVKELITKYGANKLTDIDPACYEELLKEAEAL